MFKRAGKKILKEDARLDTFLYVNQKSIAAKEHMPNSR